MKPRMNQDKNRKTYIAALCQEYSGVLVHKDPEFEKISSSLKEHRLPYKSPGAGKS